jgi:hypothetical protein
VTNFAELAELAHEAMSLVEKSEFSCIANTTSLAHPGFIGEKYDFEGNGTLVIGMNRGGSDITKIDSIEHDCLIKLKQSANTAAYHRLSKRSAELMLTWDIWQRNLRFLFEKSNVPLDRVAYIHAVPFRVLDNSKLASIYRSVWDHFTKRQVEILNPARIIFAGTKVGALLSSRVVLPHRIIPRTIGDGVWADINGGPSARRIAETHDSVASDTTFWNN